LWSVEIVEGLMRATRVSILLLLSAILPSPVSANWVADPYRMAPTVLEGVFEHPDDSVHLDLFIAAPGQYRLGWTFDRALGTGPGGEAESILIFHAIAWVIDFYRDGQWIGGSGEIFEHYDRVSGPGALKFVIPPVRVEDDGHVRSVTREWIDSIGIHSGPTLNAPIGYRLTLSQVPEPASWALMLAGFGLVGGQIRRSRPRAQAGR
jgi:hypothetical protein